VIQNETRCQQVELTFDPLNVHSRSTILMCLSLFQLNVRILMAATYRSAEPVPEAISSSSSSSSKVNGWSSDIKDYIFIERLGKRTTPTPAGQFYGNNGAIFRCQLTEHAKHFAAPPSQGNGDFAVKLVFNFNSGTDDDLQRACQVYIKPYFALPTSL
jgi:hypothetical protein